MKYVIEKSRLADSLLKISLSLAMFEVAAWLEPLVKQNEFVKTYRYIQQCAYAVAIVLAVIAFISLRKLIPKNLRRTVLDKFLFTMRKMASGVSLVSRKILMFLGLRLDRFKKTKDEKSFVFGDEEEAERKRKRHQIKSNSKWRDMNENAEKIRFLYIKYIVKKIKDGYKFRTALTPCEVKEELGFDEEAPDNELFAMYNGARYSGGSVFITDEQVELAQDIVAGKKK